LCFWFSILVGRSRFLGDCPHIQRAFVKYQHPVFAWYCEICSTQQCSKWKTLLGYFRQRCWWHCVSWEWNRGRIWLVISPLYPCSFWQNLALGAGGGIIPSSTIFCENLNLPMCRLFVHQCCSQNTAEFKSLLPSLASTSTERTGSSWTLIKEK